MSSLIVNRDTSKIFLFDNKYIKGTFKNTTGAILDLVGGELIGRIADGGANNGLLVLCDATAVDGSQFPLGIMRNAYDDLANNATVTSTICVSGDVNKNALILKAGTTLASRVSLRTIEDRVLTDTAGIYLIESTELTKFDNQ